MITPAPSPFQSPVTPEQFVAYMHAAVEFVSVSGPDPHQWQLIKDMTARTSLVSAQAAPPQKRCTCGSHS